MKPQRLLKAGLLVLLTCNLTAPVIGTAAGDAVLRLEDITVVASPVIESNEIDRYGAQKTAVTEVQMRDLNAQDLTTALRRTPGVNISRYNMIGSFGGAEGGGVFIRGMGASRPGADIKTYVDGIREIAMTASVAFFEERAAEWEQCCYPAPVRRRLEALIAEFEISSRACVLDMGTGPGILLPYLRQRVGAAGRICAFDLAFNMVRQAIAKTRAPRGMVMQADAHCMPFKSGVFDQIICFAAFPHFDRPALALQEMQRVLNHGGRLVIAHLMSRAELAQHHGSHESVARDVLPSHAEMQTLFEAAGLTLDSIQDRPGRYLAKGTKRTGAGGASIDTRQACC